MKFSLSSKYKITPLFGFRSASHGAASDAPIRVVWVVECPRGAPILIGASLVDDVESGQRL
jgi:hypothetical protein